MPTPWFRRRFALKPQTSTSGRRAASLRRRPQIESLEGRQMLSTLYVTTAVDNGNNANPTSGSLRAAILQADAQPAGTLTTIDFKIGTGPQAIHPPAGLPEITNPVVINGTTQPGYAGKPIIDIDGTNAGQGALGFDIEKSASGTSAVHGMIKGLEITDFSGGGVSVQANYFNLTSDYIGVVVIGKGTYVESNGVFGVEFFNGASHDQLTSTTVAGTNTSGGTGVVIAGTGTSFDSLSGDFIGTDPNGQFVVDVNGLPLGNAGSGVVISAGATHNSVKTSVISNNGQQGIYITDQGTSYNTLAGDHIGTDKTGGYALPNLVHGVLITSSASYNTVGGTSTSARNVISGNAYNGVAFSVGDFHNLVEGNYIGVNGAGTGALPNGASGVFFSGSSTDTVGGKSSSARNIISGNAGNGVWITGGSTKVLVEGNFIGTDSTGSVSLPNGLGVRIDGQSTSNTVGGTASGACNVISGNATWGVYISDSGTSKNLVEGNDIGTNAGITAALPNGYNGLDIVYGATSNTVGGTTSGARNIISGNAYNGVLLGFSSTVYNVVEGNFIGTDSTGATALPNGEDGLEIIGGASFNTVGGTTAGARNVISGNAQHGVLITDSGTSGNVVVGNYIGTDSTGAHPVPNYIGLTITNGATANVVGGTAASVRNVISGNSWDGVQILGSGTSSNVVAGNYIGTDATGSFAVPDGASGVYLAAGASYNTVGGTTASAGNIISGIAINGVTVSDPGTTANTIQYNYIGTDVTGEKPVSNGNDGVVIQNGASYIYVYNDLISANGNIGVLVTGGGTNNNFLTSDWIGLDGTGLKAVDQLGQKFSNATGVDISGAYNTSVGNDFISGNEQGVYIGGGATSNWIVYDYIGTGADGFTNVGNSQDGVVLDGVTNNEVGYCLLVYNGDVGILGENGSDPSNNSLVGDTFTITVNGVTYGNGNGATDFD